MTFKQQRTATSSSIHDYTADIQQSWLSVLMKPLQSSLTEEGSLHTVTLAVNLASPCPASTNWKT